VDAGLKVVGIGYVLWIQDYNIVRIGYVLWT